MRSWKIALLLLIVAGCEGHFKFREGQEQVAQGRVEDGLKSFEEANKLEPLNAEYRMARFREREKLINGLLGEADEALGMGAFDDADAIYKRILGTDQTNTRARMGLETVRMARAHQVLVDEAEVLVKRNDLQGARSRVKRVLDENGSHRAARTLMARIQTELAKNAPGAALREAYRKPITLEFRDTALRTVFELLSRSSGVNFMFDRDVKPDLRVTMFVKNTTIEDAIRFMLYTNQLEQRVLNDSTVLIYPNTPAKVREYQELVVKSFYLGNADVKQTLNLIRTIVKTRDIYVDEKLNLLVMRDTPDAVQLAQKLIANQDLAEPEVVLELEVLEIGSAKLQELGIRFPDTVGASVAGAAGTAGSLTLPEARSLNSSMVTLSVNNPLVIANLKKTVTAQNLLANPRIRVRNREKARIHIGEKVPVITTTVTANVGVSESVNYLDVGLKLEVEPNIYLEDEVAMKVGLEVSSILDIVTRSSGLQTYRLGTRNAATVLRLRDNETQILAGLIQKDERMTSNRVPGLGDIPLIGRLFSNQGDNNTKTEIVLLITPRVVRNIARLPLEITEYVSGTEGAAGASALVLRPAPTSGSGVSPPGGSGPATGVTATPTSPAVSPVATKPPGQTGATPPGSSPSGGGPTFGPTFVFPQAPAQSPAAPR